MKSIIKEIKDYLISLKILFKDGINNNSKTWKWSQSLFAMNINFLSIIVNTIIFFIITPNYIKDLIQTPNLINALILIMDIAISGGITLLLKYEM